MIIIKIEEVNGSDNTINPAIKFKTAMATKILESSEVSKIPLAINKFRRNEREGFLKFLYAKMAIAVKSGAKTFQREMELSIRRTENWYRETYGQKELDNFYCLNKPISLQTKVEEKPDVNEKHNDKSITDRAEYDELIKFLDMLRGFADREYNYMTRENKK